MNYKVTDMVTLELNVFFNCHFSTKRTLIDELIICWTNKKASGNITGIQSEATLLETLNIIKRFNLGALQKYSKATIEISNYSYYDIVTLVNWYESNCFRLNLFK